VWNRAVPLFPTANDRSIVVWQSSRRPRVVCSRRHLLVDRIRNRVTSFVGTATDTYTYPPASNRLSGINLAAGGTRAYTYDGAGNVLTDGRGAGYAYTYDAAGRMASMSINGVLQGTYKYHFAGRQAIRTTTAPAITIHSVFDSQGRRIAEYNEGTGALIREYVWLGWEPVAVIEGGVTSLIRDLLYWAACVCDKYHGGQGLDGALHPLRRGAHGDGHARQRKVPRTVVPGRERPAPELDAGLWSDDGAVSGGGPAGVGRGCICLRVRAAKPDDD
jgi:YD repeat-containing protein